MIRADMPAELLDLKAMANTRVLYDSACKNFLQSLLSLVKNRVIDLTSNKGSSTYSCSPFSLETSLVLQTEPDIIWPSDWLDK